MSGRVSVAIDRVLAMPTEHLGRYWLSEQQRNWPGRTWAAWVYARLRDCSRCGTERCVERLSDSGSHWVHCLACGEGVTFDGPAPSGWSAPRE